MKKGLLFFAIGLFLGVYFYQQSDQAPREENEEIVDGKEGVLHQVKKHVSDHQVKVLKQVLSKETISSPSFQDFTSHDSNKKAVKDPVFLKETFETLLDCYQEGCGEEPDHQGYYNEAQTVAAITINRILEENLGENSPTWMREEDLLDLFSSQNHITRKLAFEHLMKRGDQTVQVNKIIDQTSKLNDYSTGDVFKSLVPLMNETNDEVIVEGVLRVLQDPGQSALAKDEALEAFIQAKNLSEGQVKSIADSSCEGLKDINNRASTIYNVEAIAQSSGVQLKLEEHCK